MRILILGAGGVGGYFGGRLVESGADVTFLLRPARARRVAAEGLKVTSPEGDIAAKVAVVTNETIAAPYDLVLLSCKAYDLEDAITAIAPAVGPDTTILPLLNGMTHLDRLVEAFGSERVLGGVAYIAATLAEDGTVRHLNRLHGLTFGERAGGMSPRVEAIAAIFARARFASRASAEVIQDMWEKFAFLASLAGITCLTRASIGTIVATRDGAAIAREFYAECQAVAAAAGHALRAKAVENAIAYLTETGSDATASMLRDIVAGQRVELDHIVGDLLRRAEADGLKTPLLRVAYCHLQCYAARWEARA
jgi:2-dehydropantoate 2-reductase